MNIGVDLSSLNKKSLNQGVHTYIEGLLFSFKKKTNYQFQIYVNKEFYNYAKKNYFSKNFQIIVLKKKNFIIKKLLTFFVMLFESLNISVQKLHYFFINYLNRENKRIIEKSSDVILFLNAHENSYNLSINKIINFHDVLHKSLPILLNKKEILLRNVIYENCVKNSDYIVASSNAIAKDFKKFLKIKKSKIKIINEGVDFQKFSLSNNFKGSLNLPKEYLFYPAQFWKHKNHIGLIKFVEKFNYKNNKSLNLVFSGKKKSYFSEVMKHIKDKKIQNTKYIGEVPTKDLIATYFNSKFVIVPSLHESSSLVILEAIALKKTIIASNIKPFLEMSKDFKIHIYDLKSYRSFEKVLLNLLDDKKNKLQNYSDYNYKKLKNYSWDVISQKYIDLIKTLKNNYILNYEKKLS
jgi:glycosyltransferase involved in cell wall biosynthesis